MSIISIISYLFYVAAFLLGILLISLLCQLIVLSMSSFVNLWKDTLEELFNYVIAPIFYSFLSLGRWIKRKLQRQKKYSQSKKEKRIQEKEAKALLEAKKEKAIDEIVSELLLSEEVFDTE